MENKLSILYIGVSTDEIDHLALSDQIDLVVCRNKQAADIYLQNNAKPNAILSEQYLSGGTGIELHDKLRRDPAFNEVAFILLTHEFTPEMIREAFDKKVDDFYVLPLFVKKVNDYKVPGLELPSDLVNRIKFLNTFRQKYPVERPSFKEDVQFKMPLSKRIFDIVVAGTALLLLSPLLLIIIIAIRVESRGKVYYTSKRFGRSHDFDFYKLRSMRTGADKELEKLAKEKNQYAVKQNQTGVDFTVKCPECAKFSPGESCSPKLYIYGTEICENEYRRQLKEINKTTPTFNKISNDPRVTRVGKFIRNTSIDELPQLINVLKGDMSIVGNRPLPIYEVQRMLTNSEQGVDTAIRCLAPAGITGLWQVELRGKGGDMSETERKSYDIKYYTEHMIGNKYSFWYDLWLIYRTAKALFQKSSV
ncbi:MAG: sugar transferase [Bacteroidales bacterium]